MESKLGGEGRKGTYRRHDRGREGTTGCDVGLTEGESRKERSVKSEVRYLRGRAISCDDVATAVGVDAIGVDAVGVPSLHRSCSWTGAPVLRVCVLPPCSAH